MKATFSPETQQTVERAAPFPTMPQEILDPSESGIFDGIFEDFVRTAHHPEPVITQHIPINAMHGPTTTREYPVDELLEVKQTQMRDYVSYYIQDSYTQLYSDDIYNPVKLTDAELAKLVDTFISTGVAQAEQRMFSPETVEAISAKTNTTAEIKATFEQIVAPLVRTTEAVKHIGAAAVSKFLTGPFPVPAALQTAYANNGNEPDTPRVTVPYEPGPIQPGYDRAPEPAR